MESFDDFEPDGPRPRVQALTPRNLLSFGPDTPPLRFGALNVLVGPNGSGKSNVLELLALLRSAPDSISRIVAQGGGAAEWVWKGASDMSASLDVEVTDPVVVQGAMYQHRLGFFTMREQLWLEEEVIHVDDPAYPGVLEELYRNVDGKATIRPRGSIARELAPGSTPHNASILAQRRDPDLYRDLAYLARTYESMRLYREWRFGRRTPLRRPQQTDLRSDRLAEDYSNLGLVLNRMRRQPRTKTALIERLRDLYDGLTDVDVIVEGGTVQVFFTEGDYVIPATRLSDGSLRYLCLLAILLDPAPPPLVGLEEPELGLHPDLLPKVADLLVDASTRTQLIVTTHSDVIVDALTERPESVVVFDKHDGRTTFQRLDRAALGDWLQKYRLGELWTRGQIGGTRW